MPLYEYECFVCHHRFERLQRVNDTPASECPSCGGSVRRLLGVPALQFKGSGWYVTDYAKAGGRRDEAKGEASSGGSGDASSSTASDTTAGGGGEKSTSTPASGSDSSGSAS